MAAFLYETEMQNGWELFGGQLLTAQEEAVDVGQFVLQLSPSSGFTGHSLSPVDEPLQDSIWLDAADETADAWSGMVSKDMRSIAEVWPQAAAIEQCSLLDEDAGHDISEFTSAVDGSFAIHSPYSDVPSFKLSSGEIAIKAGSIEGLGIVTSCLNQSFYGDDDVGEMTIPDDVEQMEDFLRLMPEDQSTLLHSELECLDFEVDILQDPESVCGILRQLQDDCSPRHSDASLISLPSSPILSPVSTEEVDSVLSLESQSYSFATDTSSSRVVPDVGAAAPVVYPFSVVQAFVSQPYRMDDLSSKAESGRSSETEGSIVYEFPNRREKKKEQNKSAAQRYRRKKREEKGVVMTEVEILEEKNAQLKGKADDLTREINYLRGLIDEIRKQSSSS